MSENKKFNLPRGAADILPNDVTRWQVIEQTARDILRAYNYKEIRTPLFEETELFARCMGATSDVVQKQMLNLQPNKREGEEGQSQKLYSLRPEGTASVVRSYIENSLDRKEGLTKFFYIGAMFRGERPQKGRLRQFHQIGAEAIGPNAASPYLDAEVISLSVELLKAFGINDYVLKVNSLGTPEDKKNLANVLREKILSEKFKLCPTCQERFERNIFRILDCKSKECQTLIAKFNLGISFLSSESEAYYTKVKNNLKMLGVKFEEVPTLVRGLDYYTQVVFEITSPSLGSQDALGAGGRYDKLVAELGGSKDVEGIGFSLGMERVLLASVSKEESEKPAVGPDVFVIALDEILFEKGFQLLNDLRRQKISSDISYKTSSLKNQMSQANKIAARFVIILGQDEMAKGVVVLKDMEKSEQETVSIDKIVSVLKGKLC